MQARRLNGFNPDPPAITSAPSAPSPLLQAYRDKNDVRLTSRTGDDLQQSGAIPRVPPVAADVDNEDGLDVEDLVDEVMRRFLRRLEIEGERGGRQPWLWKS
jgi:hypothetical protein